MSPRRRRVERPHTCSPGRGLDDWTPRLAQHPGRFSTRAPRHHRRSHVPDRRRRRRALRGHARVRRARTRGVAVGAARGAHPAAARPDVLRNPRPGWCRNHRFGATVVIVLLGFAPASWGQRECRRLRRHLGPSRSGCEHSIGHNAAKRTLEFSHESGVAPTAAPVRIGPSAPVAVPGPASIPDPPRGSPASIAPRSVRRRRETGADVPRAVPTRWVTRGVDVRLPSGRKALRRPLRCEHSIRPASVRATRPGARPIHRRGRGRRRCSPSR